MTDHELLIRISGQLSTIAGLLGGMLFCAFLTAMLIWTRKDRQ